ncbi:MAG: hypothetical protein GC161_19025 [Planctomycetaceae bacterium]|nr:hypothetical protein [Planctomycetaceae bacterium]
MTGETTLERALAALSPYFPGLVIIGGTAHRLFELHPLASRGAHEFLTTEDVDIASSAGLASAGDTRLIDALRQAGFEERFRGVEAPEARYVLTDRPVAYLEFLAPLTGSGEKRGGKRDVLLRIGGVHAKKLRAIDLLLHAPWTARLQGSSGPVDVPVANPLTYLVQKLLKLHERGSTKRAKDVLYVFDTLTLFADALPILGAESHALLPPLTRKQRGQVQVAVRKHCSFDSLGCIGAARIAAEQRPRPPDNRQIAVGCNIGLAQALPVIFSAG